MSSELIKAANKSSAEALLQLIDSKADEECPLDEKEEWSPEDDDHSCPACAARRAYNSIAETIRDEFISIFSMGAEQ